MITLHGVLLMIFSRNKLFFGFFSFVFLIGCGLQIGEDPPSIPTYKVQTSLQQKVCSSLDYKKELKDYFFNPHSLNSSKIGQILNCISLQVSSLKSLIYNEYLTRDNIIGVLDEGLIDYFIDIESFTPFLKDILQSKKYKAETFFVKNFVENYLIHLIDTNSQADSEGLCRLSESVQIVSEDVISEFQGAEKLISKSDVDIILRFLKELDKFLSSVEKKSCDFFESFLKNKLIIDRNNLTSDRDNFLNVEKKSCDFFKSFGKNKPVLDKNDLIKDQESFLGFAGFLEKAMSDSFPAYYNFLLEKELDLVGNFAFTIPKPSKEAFYISKRRELDFIIQYLLSSENQELTLLDIKYIFMMIDFMKIFFQVYDFNQNFIIDSQELKPLSCLLSAAVFTFAKDRIPAEDRDTQIEYSAVIARYILNNQEIPEGGLTQIEVGIRAESVSWMRGSRFESIVRDVFYKDVKDLSFREVSRLIFLFFNISMEKIKELDDPLLNGGEKKEKKDK